MSKPGNDMDFLTVQLLQKYREGTLTDKERQQLEQLRAEDPFLADALEGMGYAANGKVFGEDIKTLQGRLQQRVQAPTASSTVLWRVAAAVVLLLVGTYIIYGYLQTKPEIPLLQESQVAEESQMEAAPVPDSGTFVRGDQDVQTVASLPPQQLAEKEYPELSRQLSQVYVDPVPAVPESAAGNAAEAPAEIRHVAPLQTDQAFSDYTTLQHSRSSAASAKVKSNLTGRTIQGQVLGPDQNPLPGVNVLVKNFQHGTVTNIKGQFSLQVPDSAQHLMFSFIGFEPAEVALHPGQDSLAVQLMPDDQQLSEVITLDAERYEEREEASAYTQAQLAEGEGSFKQYVEKNLRYPAEAKARGIEGTVRVAFTVMPDGSLHNFIIKKSLGYGCDEEAIRLIKEGPAWQPAVKHGVAIKQQVTLRVKFKL